MIAPAVARALPPLPTHVIRHFKVALERAKLDAAIRVYDLRHTFASLALAAGAHVVAVSSWR